MSDAIAQPAEPGSGPEPGMAPAADGATRGLRAPLLVLAGVGLALIVGLTMGARAASLVLAATTVAAAAVRGLSPGRGPAGMAVRTKAFDVTVLLVFAVGITVLALTAADV